MPVYSYTAKNKEGKTMRGYIEASSKGGAVQLLRSKSLYIVSIEEKKKQKVELLRLFGLQKKKIKIDDLVIFSRQLATMVEAGIPLVNALDILSEQIEKPFFRQVITSIRDDVKTGSGLSDALSKHKDVFSGLFINMIRAGENSGMLDEILDRLAGYIEKSSNLQKKIKSAMVYPVVVTIMAFAITLLLIIKVIPIFKNIYADFGATLPLPTQILIILSDFVREYFYLAVIIIIGLISLIRRYAKTDRGRLKIDKLKLKLPIFGNLTKKIVIGKVTRTLSTLVKSGVPILTAFEILGKTAGNKVVEEAIDSVRDSVKEGQRIAEPLSKSEVFPPMVVRMIAVGEKTGELEKMLTKISDFYDTQVETAVSGLMSIIEPLIIAFLGIVVGGIVICMFLPILKIPTMIRF